MATLFNIEHNDKKPRYLQLADSITDAIRRGKLKKGQRLHSINELSGEYLLSRDTVEKAYKLLRREGIIDSVRGKGFYVKKTDLEVPFKVLFLFNKISNYKKQIYNAFIQTLGNKAIVDLKIHHSDTRLFKSLVEDHLGEYNYFVVMPHFYDMPEEAIRIIKRIPPEQLMLLDKKIPQLKGQCAMVYQDFENDIVEALDKGLDLFRKYTKMILVFPRFISYPPEIERGFRNFCIQNNFAFSILPEIEPGMPINSKEAYILIEEPDLVNLIKNCRFKNLKVGKDVGIVSYNDTPLKEILLDGITVISTDHVKMGETSANLILNHSRESVKNPFALIRRASL